jgi:GT2 family glycosyltransferase
MKKIFVIIVTYNGSKWYDKCFGSLRASTIPIQTIVIDNASSDNTASYIKNHYPEVHLIENDKNLGFGKANNIGIRYAMEQGCDYVFLLNQDAWILPDTIEKLYILMRENPEYGILSPIHLRGDGLNLDYNFSLYISENQCLISDCIINKNIMKSIYEICFVNAALWFLSKECIKKIGYFDPLFSHYAEDADYLCRIKYHKAKIGVCPNIYGFHDREQGISIKNISLKKLYNWRKVHYIQILKNINRSFTFSLSSAIFKFILNQTHWIIQFKLKHFFVDSFAFLTAITYSYEIIKHRRVDKIPYRTMKEKYNN